MTRTEEEKHADAIQSRALIGVVQDHARSTRMSLAALSSALAHMVSEIIIGLEKNGQSADKSLSIFFEGVRLHYKKIKDIQE